MVRILRRLVAWLAATTLAVALAWLGAGMVIRNTIASPSPPVLDLAPTPAATARATPSITPAPTENGSVRDYALTGGQVTLVVSRTSAKLVAAVPRTGVSMQTWSGLGWLRVDFTSGPHVSYLIADWNGHAPLVTVVN